MDNSQIAGLINKDVLISIHFKEKLAIINIIEFLTRLFCVEREPRMPGYNRGDEYEDKIYKICESRGILTPGTGRAGAGAGADISFYQLGYSHNLEVKADLGADYGQKMLRWNPEDGWEFCKDDELTRLYRHIGVLDEINPSFVPNRHSKDKHLLTQEDKTYDQQSFEQSITIDTERLFDYYRLKDTYYMQVGGFGFYHLDNDPLNLGTPQFDGTLRLRFRAKTIHSIPLYQYGFYVVLKVDGSPVPSSYDIEEANGRDFPPISP